ncbi:hypothetical protein BJX61DRAFT_539270 [Aspergillus egyptiacus]|nr:hypothetical protein BJX61DRAFT_539270 [Aspergillus egyptiacus]
MTPSAAEAAHLSHPKYGYDCVVSLSQDSMDAIVKKYLHETQGFPIQTVCVVEPQPQQRYPAARAKEHISVEALKERTNGIDPFEIEDGTDSSNEQVQTLTRAGFRYGFRIQPGLPQGVNPADLPPAVRLANDDPDAVLLSLFFARMTIVQNGQGTEKWRKFEQKGPKSPSHCLTRVPLVNEDLPADLDTPYFKHRVDQQKQVLDMLSSSAQDSVYAVVGAAEWLLRAIDTPIEDIVRFVEFLFEWEEIRRTKEASKQIVSFFMNEQIGRISSLKDEVDTALKQAEQRVQNRGQLNLDSLPRNIMQKSGRENATNPNKGQTPGSQLLASHLHSNIGRMVLLDRLSGSVPMEIGADRNDLRALVDELGQVFEQEGEQLGNAYRNLRNLTNKFSSMSVTQVLEYLMEVVTESALGSARMAMHPLMMILSKLNKATLDMLNAEVHIPIVSDILEDLDMHTTTYLDVFCWIAATSYTVAYKDATGKAPFPDETEYDRIIDTTSWDDYLQLFGPEPGLTTTAPTTRKQRPHSFSMARRGTMLRPLSSETQKQVYVMLHGSSGAMSLFASIANLMEAAAPSGEDKAISYASAVLSGVPQMLQVIPDCLYPRESTQDPVFKTLSSTSSVAAGLSKMMFAMMDKFNLGEWKLKGELQTRDSRATGAMVDLALSLPSLAATVEHFLELSNRPDTPARTDAILTDLSSLASDMTRVSYAIAVNDDEPISKHAALVDMSAGNIAQAGLQVSILFNEREAEIPRVQPAVGEGVAAKGVEPIVQALEVEEF